jgi:S-methylmethionine-dependent homocysteine/selenocysteine methylase
MRDGGRGTRAVVLDGGLATEPERRGWDATGPLWSARVIADRPDAIGADRGGTAWSAPGD